MGEKQSDPLKNEGIAIPNMTYYFISGNLPHDYGGLTKSLLLRSKLFGKLSQTPTTFLTFGFDKDFSTKKKQLYENKKVHPKFTRILNMYNDFLSKNTNGRLFSERTSINEIKNHNKNRFFAKFSKIFRRQKNNLNFNFYEDGKSICSIDYLNNEKKRFKREEYTRQGLLCRVSYFNIETGRLYCQEFINDNNNVYLDKHYEFIEGQNELQLKSINWYSVNGVLEFSDESELRRHWIEVLELETDHPKLFLVDSRRQDKHVFRVKKAASSYYAAIIHSKHYGDNPLHVKPRYRELFSHLYNLDAVFFITEEQKEDFQRIVGEHKTFFYTPHTTDKSLDKKVLKTQSEKNKAVIISRLVESKNLTHAIKAFKLVVDEIPEAKLEIFGSGGAENKIKAEIERCNLQKNVFLKGYTNNPDNEFQKAWLTISTSHFEGFGLSNMEALGNGCPVVTYDYDYGARSLVKDNENGFVVEKYNIEQLAEKIVLLMKNEKLHEKFSKCAFQTADKYTTKHYMKHWSDALQKMIEVKEEKQELKGIFSSKRSFSVREHKIDESNLIIEFKAQVPVDEGYNLKLVGLDRRNNAVVICASSPEKPVSRSDVYRFNIDLDRHFHVKTIRANNTKTIDFYLAISNREQVTILKRLSVDQAEMPSPFLVEKYKVEPYITVKGNYSWTLQKDPEDALLR
ncbi:alpha-glucosyltransferase N-terminal domain-containing protein [Bacillus haynesii]|uniref:alpha-glucosyltransferase N-terminal domain-containing protein n=1 Tax=Bacillus haynesii TaxID=1925021 RepID=UPI00398AD4F4